MNEVTEIATIKIGGDATAPIRMASVNADHGKHSRGHGHSAAR